MGRAYRRAQLINVFANTPQVDCFPSATPMGWWLEVRRVLRDLRGDEGFKDFITQVNKRDMTVPLPTFFIPTPTGHPWTSGDSWGITLPCDILQLSGRFSPFLLSYLSGTCRTPYSSSCMIRVLTSYIPFAPCFTFIMQHRAAQRIKFVAHTTVMNQSPRARLSTGNALVSDIPRKTRHWNREPVCHSMHTFGL